MDSAMTREQAIAALTAQGLDATPRDWNFGETIVIMSGHIKEANGMKWYAHSVYLYPHDGRWHVLEHGVPDPSATYDSLELAVADIHRFIPVPFRNGT